jgi:DnaK suppressor protein
MPPDAAAVNIRVMNALSDDDLRGARQALLARNAELLDRLERVRRDLRREREPLPRDSDDAAIAMENDEILQAIEQSADGELKLIALALERIEQGSFARCDTCGGEIDAARLQAVPHAPQCRGCARER